MLVATAAEFQRPQERTFGMKLLPLLKLHKILSSILLFNADYLIFQLQMVKKLTYLPFLVTFFAVPSCEWGIILQKCHVCLPGWWKYQFWLISRPSLFSHRRKLEQSHYFSVFWPIRGVFYKQISSDLYHVGYLGPIHSCIRLVFES